MEERMLLNLQMTMVPWFFKPKEEEEPKSEPTKAKTKRKKYPFELHVKFINEIKNDEKI